ncbi:SAM-dependent methyltransferase [Nocardioides cavernae]|uniref:SAM-dependent methyltransferase n=1 Tax=Nocardioides cavernae TaxID=1921566 RepID=A0A7Y9H576_9ACTN|nr:class I SAM-dependent methyltransferase [Nocardioides cavernae]NYE38145.1 SAM-dependent methyltransferase [Nocardioides cavernae]
MTPAAAAATPGWVRGFYDRKSEVAGPSGVLDHHVERAQAVETLTGRVAGRVLELGAGAGGSAVATARLGYDVTAVELSGVRAGFARDLAREHGVDLTVVEGDFLTHDLGARFDVVTMWNGFGMGDDAHQRAILEAAGSRWLDEGGHVVLDVYNPAAWIRWAGTDEVDEETGCRNVVDYDVVGARFVDTWWFDGPDGPPMAQTVRCYAPVDLELLARGTGLCVESCRPAGHPAFTDRMATGPLGEDWGYRAVLRHDV